MAFPNFTTMTTVSPTPVEQAAQAITKLNPIGSTAQQLTQAVLGLGVLQQDNINKSISTVISLSPASNFQADTSSNLATAEQLPTLLEIQQALAEQTPATIVQSPGVVSALSGMQYSLILQTIITDLSSRFNITLDPTKLIYKMIQGKTTLNNAATAGVEISTLSTTNSLRIRFYFNFSQSFDLKFIKIYHDQNYTVDNDAASIIYLYEGSVRKEDFYQLSELVQTASYQNIIPGVETVLIPESGTVPMFLSEDLIPIALEH